MHMPKFSTSIDKELLLVFDYLYRKMVVNLVCGLHLGKLDYIGEAEENQYVS